MQTDLARHDMHVQICTEIRELVPEFEQRLDELGIEWFQL